MNRRMSDSEGTIHNMLEDALGVSPMGIRYLGVTMCGLEASANWTTAGIAPPTSCHRCQMLAAWQVRARA